MKKTLILCLTAALIGFSAYASDTKQAQLKKLRESVECTNFCAFKVFVLENSRTKSDSAKMSKLHNNLEQKARKDLQNAIRAEIALRKNLRRKWPQYEEIETLQSPKPKNRAKL